MATNTKTPSNKYPSDSNDTLLSPRGNKEQHKQSSTSHERIINAATSESGTSTIAKMSTCCIHSKNTNVTSKYKLNGRRRTLAPNHFRNQSNDTSSYSSSESSPTSKSQIMKDQNFLSKSSGNSASPSNAKRPIIKKVCVYDDHDDQNYRENIQNIPPSHIKFSTPTGLERRDGFGNKHLYTVTSISNPSSDLDANNDAAIPISKRKANIQIHSTSNHNDKPESERIKYNPNQTLSSSSSNCSSESSDFQPQKKERTTNAALRRSKRIRNKKQKLTEKENEDQMPPSSQKTFLESNSLMRNRERKTKKNEAESTLSLVLQNNGSIDKTIMSYNSMKHVESLPTFDCSTQSDTEDQPSATPSSDTIILNKTETRPILLDGDESIGSKEGETNSSELTGNASLVKNQQGRRRSIRLSKRKFNSGIKVAECICSTSGNSVSLNHISSSHDGYIDSERSRPHLCQDEDSFQPPKGKILSKTTIGKNKGVNFARLYDNRIDPTEDTLSEKQLSKEKCNDSDKKERYKSHSLSEGKNSQSSYHVLTEISSNNFNAHIEMRKNVKKRRRRSSLGLHAGGLISVKDIERVGMEAMARNKQKNSKISPIVDINNFDRIMIEPSSKVDNCSIDCSTADDLKVQHFKMETHSIHVESTTCQNQRSRQEVLAMKLSPDSGVTTQNELATTESINQTSPFYVKSSLHSEPTAILSMNKHQTYCMENDPPKRGTKSINEELEPQETLLGKSNEKTVVTTDIIRKKPASCLTISIESKHGIKESDERKYLKDTIPSSEDIMLKTNDFLRHVDAKDKPCMSARLFACVILIQKKKDGDFCLDPLLPLLNAFVNAEISSLQDIQMRHNFKKKKLHFCSIDNSSMITPVDTEEKSVYIIEDCIDSFHNILKEVQDITQELQEKLKEIVSTLQQISELPRDHFCFTECAKTMPFHWPSARFKSVAKHYFSELQLILYPSAKGKSKVRECLGDIIGRAIRFHLRKFFNPVPVSLHAYSKSEQPDYNFSRSDVHKIVELTGNEEQRDTAIADGSISSVVSHAILRIHKFNDFTGWFRSESHLNLSFCTRAASKQGIQVRGSVIILSNSELEEVLTDIDESHIVLAGIRACKFFLALMRWEGVHQAIEQVGGWSKVERFASIFAENELEKEMPDEMHFQLFLNVEALLKKIEVDFDHLCKIENECNDSLRNLWKRFRCGTKSKDLLRINPGIKTIQKHLKAGGNTYFPGIITPAVV